MLCQQVQGHFAKADVPKPGHAGGGAQPTAARTFARDKRTDNVCAVSGSSGFHHTAPEKLFFISLSLLLLGWHPRAGSEITGRKLEKRQRDYP